MRSGEEEPPPCGLVKRSRPCDLMKRERPGTGSSPDNCTHCSVTCRSHTFVYFCVPCTYVHTRPHPFTHHTNRVSGVDEYSLRIGPPWDLSELLSQNADVLPMFL